MELNEMELSSWLPLGEGGSLGSGINAGAGIEVSSDCSFATSMIQCLRPRILTQHGWRVGGTGSNILSKHVNPHVSYIKTTLIGCYKLYKYNFRKHPPVQCKTATAKQTKKTNSPLIPPVICIVGFSRWAV